MYYFIINMQANFFGLTCPFLPRVGNWLELEQVIAGVMHYLILRIPPHVRVDLFEIVFTQFNRVSGISLPILWLATTIVIRPYKLRFLPDDFICILFLERHLKGWNLCIKRKPLCLSERPTPEGLRYVSIRKCIVKEKDWLFSRQS